MATTLRDRLDRIPRKTVAARLPTGEGARKFLAESEIARVVVRVIEHAGITQKDLAFRLGFEDQTPVSRWCAGHENAQAIGRMWSRPELRPSILVALAEGADSGAVEVRTIVTVGKQAVSV
jgi:hypothetical protein